MLVEILFHISAAQASASPACDSRLAFVMGAPLEARVCADSRDAALAAAGAAFERVRELDEVMSLYKETSELSRLNRYRRARPSPALRRVLELALEAARKSGGAFDPTAGSERPGWPGVAIRGGRASLAPGARVDLGGIGKGFALDEAAELLRRIGASSARLNFGGQILAFGEDPESTDGRWAVQLPDGRALRLGPGLESVSVSGDSERPGHIRDPRSGRPLRRDGAAVAIAASGAQADAWSTAVYVLGPERGPETARRNGVEAYFTKLQNDEHQGESTK